jgi:hypothetical protein
MDHDLFVKPLLCLYGHSLFLCACVAPYTSSKVFYHTKNCRPLLPCCLDPHLTPKITKIIKITMKLGTMDLVTRF